MGGSLSSGGGQGRVVGKRLERWFLAKAQRRKERRKHEVLDFCSRKCPVSMKLTKYYLKKGPDSPMNILRVLSLAEL
jgi:hypothetical protein